jgi:catechol 2,3-dioxygenase-like lactoylglutathione lyase family enzyme
MFTGTDHVGFSVSDLDRSIAFYTAFLGDGPVLRTIYEAEYLGRVVGYPGCRLDVAMFHLPGTKAYLELLQYLEPVSGRVDLETNNVGNAHLCLESEDLSADYERLRDLGVEFRNPHPVEIMFGPYKGGKAVYIRDPDGITVELLQPPLGGIPSSFS